MVKLIEENELQIREFWFDKTDYEVREVSTIVVDGHHIDYLVTDGKGTEIIFPTKIGVVVPLINFADCMLSTGCTQAKYDLWKEYLKGERRNGKKYLIQWLPKDENNPIYGLRGVSVYPKPDYDDGGSYPPPYYFYDSIGEVRSIINNLNGYMEKHDKNLESVLKDLEGHRTIVL